MGGFVCKGGLVRHGCGICRQHTGEEQSCPPLGEHQIGIPAGKGHRKAVCGAGSDQGSGGIVQLFLCLLPEDNARIQ